MTPSVSHRVSHTDQRASVRARMYRQAILHADGTHVLVVIRDLSASGLLVQTELVLPVGETAVLLQAGVAGRVPVRVVRHTYTEDGKIAMGLEILSPRREERASEMSGLFAL